MLSSVTDRECDVDNASLDALQPENVAKNRNTDIIPCMYNYTMLLCYSLSGSTAINST